MTFKLKSGNKPQFKQVGSSPAKQYKQPAGPRAEVKPEKFRSTPMTSEQMDKAHDISAHITEGSIESQALRRKENKKQTSKAKLKAIWDKLRKPIPRKKSPAKHFVDDVPEHNDGHSDDLQTPEEHEAGKSPAKQTDTTYADGSKKSKREQDFSKRHTAEKAKDKYWYKIDGKKATKAQYIKYENKPGNMEGGGKQTNNPDVYGRIASNHGRGPKTKK